MRRGSGTPPTDARTPRLPHAPSRVRHLPQRRCVACRATLEKRQLTRLVRDPDGSIRADPGGRAEGRGAYLCHDPNCRRRVASKPALLARALRSPAGSIAPALLADLAGEPVARLPAGHAEGASR